MQVLYQIPGDVRGGPLGEAELRRREAILNTWAAAGVRVEVADAPGGPLSIESQVEEAFCVPPMVAAVHGRPRAPDAVIVGCFGDPGVAALRELLDCPVVGPFEASLHLAAQLGTRVGVVTVVEGVVPMLERLVRGFGLADVYAGATAVNVPVLDVTRHPADRAAQVAAAAEPLIRDRGADVLVLGCMSMAFLDIAEQVSTLGGVPVVNPARCALKTAEMLVALKLRHSRRAYPPPSKGAEIFKREAAR